MPQQATIPRVCEQCNAPFLATLAEVKRGFAKFCSRTCFFAHRKRTQTRDCRECGQPFTFTPHRIETAWYCSRSCYHKHRSSRPDLVAVDGVIHIPLGSRMHPGHIAVIDEEDYPLVCDYRWFAHRSKNTFYAFGQALMTTDGIYPRAQLHRLIMRPPAHLWVDHVDFNGLNCRRENLRIATMTQNLIHQRRNPGKCPYRGVTETANGGWNARIGYEGARFDLGTFATAEAAALAYDEAAIRLHGGFSRTNY